MHRQENKVIEAAKRGFTLVELLVVVAILGILGAIGMQGVTGHIEKTRKTAAKTGVDTIKGAVTNYLIDKKKSTPPSDLSVLVNADGDQEPFLDGGEGALVDPWDNEYKIEVKGKRFVIISAGPDGQFGNEDDIRSDKIEKTKKWAAGLAQGVHSDRTSGDHRHHGADGHRRYRERTFRTGSGQNPRRGARYFRGHPPRPVHGARHHAAGGDYIFLRHGRRRAGG